MKKIIYLFVLLFCYTSYSQSLSVFNVDASNFPTIKASFFALDADGKPISNLSQSDFTAAENGKPRTVFNISCPDVNSRPAVSSVLVFDMSGSMKEGPPRIESAKKAANAWIEGLPLEKSECALVSFSDFSYIVRDFTTNRELLKSSINQFVPTDYTNYNQALIDEPCGGLQVAKRGKYKRVIVFLTDGLPNQEPNTAKIINFAQQNNITIYAVTLDMPAPQCIKDMTAQTGGAYFENITSQKEAEDTYLKLLNLAQGYETCEIEWQSVSTCAKSEIALEIKLNPLNLSSKVSYWSPDNSIAHLEIVPSYINFKRIVPGIKKDTTVKVTAQNSDFNNVTVNCTNPAFSISPQNFSLPENQSIDLQVSYIPSDSGYTFSEISLESDNCPAIFYAVGGFPGKRPKTTTLKLLSPNGGEVFVAGSDTLIKWKGITDIDTVKIEYTIDNGNSWNIITNNGKGLSYLWGNIPKPGSNQCKIRIKQLTEYELDAKKIQFSLKGHTHVVNCAVWSPDGSRIATAGWDNIGIVWDAQTGKKLNTLTGHTFTINNLIWSPDGRYIATASKDSSAIIWDANSGAKLHLLTDHNKRVENISWSPDGTRLVTASWDSTAIIWDFATGKKIRSLIGHSTKLNDVSWSPDGSMIASADIDSTTFIWDPETGTKLSSIRGNKIHWNPNGSRIGTMVPKLGSVRVWDPKNGTRLAQTSKHGTIIHDFCWSPDGAKIATVGEDNNAIINDAASGSMLQKLMGHTDGIRAINWSSDGSRIVTGSDDRTAMVWDAETGIRLNVLKGHSEYLTYVAWSPDGYRFSSASSDNYAIIWLADSVINQLQEDESDQVFSIVAPLVKAEDVDLKQCLSGSIKDSLVKNFISNIGSYKLKVESIYFSGPDAAAFKLTSGVPPYELNTGESRSTEFCFLPKRTGIHSAVINIITQSETLTYNIVGEGVEPQLQVLTNLLDFGEVELGREKLIQDTLLLKNLSNFSVNINNVVQLGPDKIQFEILSGGGSFTLNPNESRKLTVRFKPQYGGRTSGQLGFEYNGVGSPAKVQLFGTAIGGGVYITDDSAYAGDKTNFKLVLANVKPEGIAAIAPNFEAQIRFQKTILAPYNNADWRIVNDSIYLNIKGTFNTSMELAKIELIAGLGITTETMIDIVYMKLKDDSGNYIDYNFETISGSFKLLGICSEGGTRLFNPTGKIEIMQINPNPASQDVEIKVNLIEDGATTLSIFNSNGLKIKEFNMSDETGFKTIKLDIRDYSNGLYFIQLHTPTVLENQKLIIIK